VANVYTHKPAVAYSLDGQIELLIHSHSEQILRTVSYDDGETWLEWIKMKNHQTRRAVGFASTADSHTKYMVYQIFNPFSPMEDVFPDSQKYVLKRSEHYGFDWDEESKPMTWDEGRFLSGPAVLCSPTGHNVTLFGQGLDEKIYWQGSKTRGRNWKWRWEKIGDAVFKSEPAAVMSADGLTILFFAIGMDDRCYYSRSTDGGNTWDPYTAGIKQKKFTSGPSACLSADGRKVVVAARGRDDKIYVSRSSDTGSSWSDWTPISSGVFNSGPGLCAAWDLSKIFVFAVGRDHKIWKAHSMGVDAPFAGWWEADKNKNLSAI
jgi:hypothetical protein